MTTQTTGMRADDERHGTNAGYMAHALTDRDYCQPCRTAHADYHRTLWRRRYKLGVDSLYIPALGTRRRIQALQCLGWRYSDIDTEAGVKVGWSKNAIVHARVNITQATAVAEAYERLSMRLGPAPKCRTWAQRKGWLPPLAWDDIDDPTEHPETHTVDDDRPMSSVDPVVVARFVARDITPGMWATTAEKREIVRLWTGSHGELGRLTGWKVERYIERQDGAA